MSQPEHALERPSFVTAVWLFGLWTGGVLVTQTVTPLFWIGIAICLCSGVGTMWRYQQPLVETIKGNVVAGLPRWEAIAVSGLVVVEFFGALYLGAPVLVSEVQSAYELVTPSKPIRLAERQSVTKAAFPEPPAVLTKPPKPLKRLLPYSQSPPEDSRAPVASPPANEPALTIDDLNEAFRGKTQAQIEAMLPIYYGRKIRFSGTVFDVTNQQPNGEYILSMNFHRHRGIPTEGEVLLFKDDIRYLNRGQSITAECRIYVPDKYGARYAFSDCVLAASK